jgi:hypothetical protein
VEPERSPDDSNQLPVLPLQLPGPTPVGLAPAHEPRAPRRGPGKALAVGAAGIGGLGLVGALAWTLLLPAYVRRACIEQAAAHGIALSVDAVRLRGGGFVLTGVKASAEDLRGASVTAPEIDVETHGLKPARLTASGLEVALEGRWSSVSSALARWRASDRGGQDGAWSPEAIVVDGSRVVWRSPIGDNARVEAAGVHLDAQWSDDGSSMHATSSVVTVVVPGGSLGPWRVDLDRDGEALRARVALDPAVPDTSTLLFVGNDAGVTSADVTIPRAPLARLGVAPALFGLRGDVQVEASAHYVPFGPRGGVSASTRGGLHGVAFDGVPRPLDVAWDMAASGERGDGNAVDLQKAAIAAGPLVGNARGTLKTFDDGFRIDLAWRAGPVRCTAFDAPAEPGQLDLGYAIRKLAQDTGLATVRGDVSASATLAFDSRDLGATAFSFTPQVRCDVAIGKSP